MKDDESVKISFRISLKDKNEAEQKARARGVDLSTYVRSALERAINPTDSAYLINQKLNVHEWLLQGIKYRGELIIVILEQLTREVLDIKNATGWSKDGLTQREVTAAYNKFVNETLVRLEVKGDFLPRLKGHPGEESKHAAR